MSVEQREEVQILRSRGHEHRERVVEKQPSIQNVLLSRLSQFIWLVVAVIVLLIAFRFVLMLLAANAANLFASVVYGITDILVGPFVGLVDSPAFQGGAVLDVPSLFAVVVYPLLGWAIVQLLRIVLRDTRGVRRVKTVQRDRVS